MICSQIFLSKLFSNTLREGCHYRIQPEGSVMLKLLYFHGILHKMFVDIRYSYRTIWYFLIITWCRAIVLSNHL